MSIGLRISIAVAVFVTALIVVLTFERPPMQSEQNGFRGLGMVQVENPRTVAAQQAANRVPEAVAPVPAGGPPATSVYKNVQVLNDLNILGMWGSCPFQIGTDKITDFGAPWGQWYG